MLKHYKEQDMDKDDKKFFAGFALIAVIDIVIVIAMVAAISLIIKAIFF